MGLIKNLICLSKEQKMIDEFHVMYMYKKIQAEAATTDIKTLE
ncbi:DNA-binding protein, partial [Escherichia coli]|nr:DNA-binding protein [Escherichia coli]